MHLAVLLALAATLPLAPARLITTSQEAFTQSAAEVLKVELGKRVHAPVTVAVKGPLELKVDLADKGQVLVGLLKPWRVCESAADQEHCQTNGVAFIGKLADELLASLKGPPPVSAPQLRLYVRNRSYIEQIK